METRILDESFPCRPLLARQASTPSMRFPQSQAFAGQQSVIVDLTASQGTVTSRMLDTLSDLVSWGLEALSVPVGTQYPTRASRRGTSALDAIDAISELFVMDAEDIASIVGIGRTTPMYWRRTNGVPRPSTVRQLWRLYGLAMSLSAVFGLEGTKSWLRSGHPSPLSILEGGNLDAFESLVGREVYDPALARQYRPAIATLPDVSVELGGGRPARVSRKRVRRGRLR